MAARIRFGDEWDGGLGWTRVERELAQRWSHAVAAGGRVWLVDPVDGDGLDERLRALGEPAGVVQLLDRHARDSDAVAARLSVPLHRIPRTGVPGAPFDVVPLVDFPGWREVALWFPSERVLVTGDALGTLPYFLAPGERLAVHPLLRAFPPRALASLEPEHVLVGHGEGLHGPNATAAVRGALTTSRRRLPAAYANAVRFMLGRN